MSLPYEFASTPEQPPIIAEDPFALDADLFICFLKREPGRERDAFLGRVQARLGEGFLTTALETASPSSHRVSLPVDVPEVREGRGGARQVLFVYDDPAEYIGTQVAELFTNLGSRTDEKIVILPPEVIDPTTNEDFANSVGETLIEVREYEQERAGSSPVSVTVVLPNTRASMDYLCH